MMEMEKMNQRESCHSCPLPAGFNNRNIQNFPYGTARCRISDCYENWPMEEFKHNLWVQGLISFSQVWTNGVSTVGNLVKKTNRKFSRRRCIILVVAIAAVGLAVVEIKTSYLVSRCFSWLAQNFSLTVAPGPNLSLCFPEDGPYDQRLGYTRLPDFIKYLGLQGYRIEAQARPSKSLNAMTYLGLNPGYREKNQAGLTVFDHEGRKLFKALYPQRVYSRFDAIPPLIVNTLLFIENRELLDFRPPHRNPAIEWGRIARSVMDRGIHILIPDHPFGGGSTLATQIEKFRHSPDGRTLTVGEKLRQIVSASLRAYREGLDTTAVRHQLVIDYLNSVPLAAFPGYGEVHGIGDGLWALYGTDFNTVNRLLGQGYESDDGQRAMAYKQILSLFVAQRRPSYYLVSHRDALEPITNSHLRILCKAGIITPALRDSALRTSLRFRTKRLDLPAVSFVDRKAANTIRRRLLSALGLSRLYDLDRLDLSVKSTLNGEGQDRVNRLLYRLKDPEYVNRAGLRGYQLLDWGNPERVTYSFTLYEHVGNANVVRIQTDNFAQPFDINEGVKIELGSTAKLRTIVTYLEIISSLHRRYAGLPAEELRTVDVDRKDELTRWALDYLSAGNDLSLAAMLEAALKRRYPANPGEIFFTGGGRHQFQNFDPEDDSRILSVRDGFRKSVNLVFIRLMRDIVHYYICLGAGPSSRILADVNDPSRLKRLARFADQEGRVFLNRFFNKYRQRTPEEQLELLLGRIRPKPSRLATVFRFVKPEASIEEFSAFLQSRLPSFSPSTREIERLYETYGSEKLSLQDRGYLTRLHPLELWLVAYLRVHPAADRAEVIQVSTGLRQEIYRWLFNPRNRSAQNVRIRSLLEADAFLEIHGAWKRMGYPFESLVPSYATAIGSSADRPESLAELVGIILNHGIRYPVARIDKLHFASQTPYETLLSRNESAGQRVLAPEIASAVRNALLDAAERGTARQIRNAFIRSDGAPLAVGGKTGTGDNRYETVDRYGNIVKSRVINRAAVFVFFIGNRFFGVITAYVPGKVAADYGFTSSLPVRILKMTAPTLTPMIERAENDGAAALKEGKAE